MFGSYNNPDALQRVSGKTDCALPHHKIRLTEPRRPGLITSKVLAMRQAHFKTLIRINPDNVT